MRRVALKIAYLGTDFYGFQRQPGLTTVEGEILSALDDLGVVKDIEQCGFGIAGRTDRGVHALGNVISFLTQERIIINQINDVLPRSIRILSQAKVPLNFKVRYASGRSYRYLMPIDPEISGVSEFNLKNMIEASKLLKGTHDFSNFSKRSERNPVRTIDEITIEQQQNSIQIDVVGESFLWNMVRKMVTVLLDVGYGLIQPEEIDQYFDPKKELPIKPMPAEGLILMDINYKDIEFTEDLYAKKSFVSYLKSEYITSQSIALAENMMIKSL